MTPCLCYYTFITIICKKFVFAYINNDYFSYITSNFFNSFGQLQKLNYIITITMTITIILWGVMHVSLNVKRKGKDWQKCHVAVVFVA